MGHDVSSNVSPPLGYQPNIVFIQTDDQDVEIGGLAPMARLRSLVGAEGASMQHWYVNTPVCCPSRTETLSGRYHHNMRDANGEEWERSGCGDEPVGEPHGCARISANGTLMT
jgi:arylsulfatase A-like enzyme